MLSSEGVLERGDLDLCSSWAEETVCCKIETQFRIPFGMARNNQAHSLMYEYLFLQVPTRNLWREELSLWVGLSSLCCLYGFEIALWAVKSKKKGTLGGNEKLGESSRSCASSEGEECP